MMNIFASPVYAEITNPVIQGEYSLGGIVSVLISFLMVIGVITAFLFLVLGALKWISSGGDKNQLAEARQQIVQALIGLFVLFSLWAILGVFEIMFNIDLIHMEIPGLTDPVVPCGGCDPGEVCCPAVNTCCGACLPDGTCDPSVPF